MASKLILVVVLFLLLLVPSVGALVPGGAEVGLACSTPEARVEEPEQEAVREEAEVEFELPDYCQSNAVWYGDQCLCVCETYPNICGVPGYLCGPQGSSGFGKLRVVKVLARELPGSWKEAPVPQGCGGCQCETCYEVQYTYSTPVWVLGDEVAQSRMSPYPVAQVPSGWNISPDLCTGEKVWITRSGFDDEAGKQLGNLHVTLRFGESCPGSEPPQ